MYGSVQSSSSSERNRPAAPPTLAALGGFCGRHSSTPSREGPSRIPRGRATAPLAHTCTLLSSQAALRPLVVGRGLHPRAEGGPTWEARSPMHWSFVKWPGLHGPNGPILGPDGTARWRSWLGLPVHSTQTRFGPGPKGPLGTSRTSWLLGQTRILPGHYHRESFWPSGQNGPEARNDPHFRAWPKCDPEAYLAQIPQASQMGQCALCPTRFFFT